MKLGFLSGCLKLPLPEVVKWAAEAGFSVLELPVVRGVEEAREYVGSAVNIPRMDTRGAVEMRSLFARANLGLSALTYCDNMLTPVKRERAEKVGLLEATIDAAPRLGVEVVSCFIGRAAELTVEENLKEAARLFKPMLKRAERKKVKLAVENGPMPGWPREGLCGNVAYAPELWEKLFALLPEPHFGLNFDPSHLYWLGVDIPAAVRAFAARIFHTHAKDTEILREKLSRCRSLLGTGWWRYRMPGLGEIDWRRYLDALTEVGYQGALSIEYEDPIWHGSEEKTKRGLVFARSFLQRQLP